MAYPVPIDRPAGIEGDVALQSRTYTELDAAGSFGVMAGDVLAGCRIDDAFALVGRQETFLAGGQIQAVRVFSAICDRPLWDLVALLLVGLCATVLYQSRQDALERATRNLAQSRPDRRARHRAQFRAL